MFFITPWAGVVIRNCESSGKILNFVSMQEYQKFKEDKRKSFWLYLPLKIFMSGPTDTLIGVFVCPECASMNMFNELLFHQNHSDIRNRLCLHSRVASAMVDNWRRKWNMPHKSSTSNYFHIKFKSNRLLQ